MHETKIKLDDGAIMPTRAHDTDAGLDLYAREGKVIPSGGSAVFDTGVHIELPYVQFDSPAHGQGCSGLRISLRSPSEKTICSLGKNIGCWSDELVSVGFLKSKSGLNVNHGITSEGVIDMGYTGSIKVKLYNHGEEDYTVSAGDKISQLVILPILTPTLELVDKLEETERGDNGFGSTGD